MKIVCALMGYMCFPNLFPWQHWGTMHENEYKVALMMKGGHEQTNQLHNRVFSRNFRRGGRSIDRHVLDHTKLMYVPRARS